MTVTGAAIAPKALLFIAIAGIGTVGARWWYRRARNRAAVGTPLDEGVPEAPADVQQDQAGSTAGENRGTGA
jgi:hypothetical protein